MYTRSKKSIGISFLLPNTVLSELRFSSYCLCNEIASIANNLSDFVNASIDFSASLLKSFTTSKIFLNEFLIKWNCR